jgi:hypothetical protein
MFNVDGYWEFGNHSTLKYISVHHYFGEVVIDFESLDSSQGIMFI